MRKIVLLTTFFGIAPAIFLFAVIFFLFLTYQKSYHSNSSSVLGRRQTVDFAALPGNENNIAGTAQSSNARIEIITQFLKKYRSPLVPYAKHIVDTSDQYGIDFRLIPAIAMQESNLCRVIPDNSYNCWGFGIYGGRVTRFKDYAEGISVVTKTLALKYKQRGLVTPNEIMSMYTPSSNGSWANSVNHFMNQLQ